MFSRAIANDNEILCLVVLSQRQVFNQKYKVIYAFKYGKWYKALLHPKLYFTLFAIFGINFSYF